MWAFSGHSVGVTMRYIGEYNDDSELTIEKYGLAPVGSSLGDLSSLSGELIQAWVVFDIGYSVRFGGEALRTTVRAGVINVLDQAPPEAEGPLGYDVGVHDPRGRVVYLRATGEF
jgi:outer membrane receptor protein involved in Fe transport